jgi:hypothetical protein
MTTDLATDSVRINAGSHQCWYHSIHYCYNTSGELVVPAASHFLVVRAL